DALAAAHQFDASVQHRARSNVNKCLVFAHNTPIIQRIGSKHMLVWEDEVRHTTTTSNSTAPTLQRDARSVTPSLASAVAATPAPLNISSITASAPAAAASMQSPSNRRVNVADKRVINGATDVNQLVPFK